MNIYEFCSYFNEDLISSIKIQEGRRWLTQLIITECDLTHSYSPKSFGFPFEDDPLVCYRKLDGITNFKKPGWGVSGRFPFFRYKDMRWRNEGRQRDFGIPLGVINDDDILVMSDIDEIVDPDCVDRIVCETRKRGVVTFKMRYSMIYFDLMSRNEGAPDWSYRVFFMTGRFFKAMKKTPNKLRKAGEQGRLMNEVHCIQEYCGYHHSWLGDTARAMQKWAAYSHVPSDFGGALVSQGQMDIEFIGRCIREGRSFLSNGELLEPYSGALLDSVEQLKTLRPDLFFGSH